MSYIGIQPSDINLSSVNIDDGSLVTADFQDGAVSTLKIADNAVTTIKLANTGVVSGTYSKFIVNAKGQVTQGLSATTLSDYGITDATPFSASLAAIAALVGTTGLLRKTAASTWVLDNTAYLSKTTDTFTGDLTMAGNIIPLTDVTYTLGSPSKMWKDLYVGPGSIYLNGKKILQDVSSTIVFSTDVNQNLRIATSGTGNLELQTDAGGAVLMKATLNISSGKRIVDSAGINVEFGNAINMNSQKIINLATPTQATDAATKAYVDAGTAGDATIVRTTGTQTIAGQKTFTGDVILQGNFTVSGTTTTVNSQTVLLADNILELNSDFTSGTPTEDSGFQVRRGDLGIVSFIWDETNDRFTMKDGTGAYLPLYTTSSITAGSFIGTFSGNASSATKLQTARTINGAAFDGTANISFTTDAVGEGSSNLYFTNARASSAAPVQSVFGRSGAVSMTSSDVTTALNYTPVNKAGDTMSGQLTATQFNGPLVGNVTGNVTGNVSGLANSETLASVTGRSAVTSTPIAVQTSAGGNQIIAYKIGSTYGDLNNGAFLAKTDNADGTANLFYQGINNGVTTFKVRADGLVTANAGFVGPVTGHASLDLALTGGTMTGLISSTSGEILRGNGDSAYISSYNSAGSARNGYIQFNTGSTGLIVKAESNNQLTLQGSGGGGLTVQTNNFSAFSHGMSAATIQSLGIVQAAGASGFAATTFASNTRNPIYRFSNADGYGLSYFQGTSGKDGNDSIGFHYGTPSGAGSNWSMNATGDFDVLNGNIRLQGNAKSLIAGPNLTWGSSIYFGGNGRDSSVPVAAASVVTTNGNVHIDGGSGNAIYLGFYSGTGGTNFGNGASGIVATVNSAGAFSAPSFTGTMYGDGSNLTGIVGDPNKIFNNTGQAHGTNTNYNTVGFGNRFMQAGTGSPFGQDVQSYLTFVGLGSEYGSTQYGHQFAMSRVSSGTGGNAYPVFRQLEGGTWGGWSRINAGYSDGAGAVLSAPNRTDPTSYPVVWNTTGGNSQNYTCAAVTITSSTGTLNATNLNGFLSQATTNNSYTWNSGRAGSFNYFASVGSVGANTTANMMAYAMTGSGDAAYMAFHRAGVYAINFGLDTDNVIRMGGWSDGANVIRWSVDAAGNLAARASLNAPQGTFTNISSSGTTNVNVLNWNSTATINGYSPSNGVVRLTPNLHLNSVAGNAVILNWDNGGSGSTQAVRIGNGSGTDAWYVTHAGNSVQTGDMTAFSDIRVKTDIQVIPDALAKVKELRGVTFVRTDQGLDDSRRTGVIAQEVEAVLPEAVRETMDGTKTVAYGNMVGLLIEAIKELNAKVESLQAQLDAKE